MKTIQLQVYDYIGFDDYGCVEMSVFYGNADDPFLTKNISIKDMVKEFIDIRVIPSTGKMAVDHYKERDALVKELKKAIETLEAA
jgi:hypothetical protein